MYSYPLVMTLLMDYKPCSINLPYIACCARQPEDTYLLQKGGLGLIHIGTFLMTQKCSWIKHEHNYTIETGVSNLRILSP